MKTFLDKSALIIERDKIFTAMIITRINKTKTNKNLSHRIIQLRKFFGSDYGSYILTNGYKLLLN